MLYGYSDADTRLICMTIDRHDMFAPDVDSRASSARILCALLHRENVGQALDLARSFRSIAVRERLYRPAARSSGSRAIDPSRSGDSRAGKSVTSTRRR